MTPPSTSPPKKSRLHWALKSLGLLLIVALLGGLLFYWTDFDFQRPAKPLVCEAPSPNQKPLRFIAFGDFGQGTPFQAELGSVMGRVYDQTPYPIALLLGDNLYPDGDVEKLARNNFEKPYEPLIRRNVRFLAAIGDHDDHHGHVKDEMRYFKMPNDYYQVSEGPVDFFILNTTFFMRNPKQRAWLQQALQHSTARWKVVIAHHPLYSSGRHGNTEHLRPWLEPLLAKTGVDLYLAGHDHDYERFYPIQGVRYIVAGGGGSFLYNFRKIKPQSAVHLKTHSFVMFEVAGNQMWMKAFNRFGDVIDCDHWEKPPVITLKQPPQVAR